MISTVKITPSMFPEIYEAILRDWPPVLPREGWQRLFVPRWACDEGCLGYALADGGRIVGILGTLFSERRLESGTARFCNLHAWHVKPEYRARSLALMKPVLELKDHTLTDFTPSAAVAAISKRLGFVPLDAHVAALPPIPSRGNGEGAALCELEGRDDPRSARLAPGDLQILRDHQDIECGHLLACAGGGHCYVVYSRIAQHRVPYCLIHYVSSPQLFAAEHAAIRRHLMRSSRTRLVIVEARLLNGVRVPMSIRTAGREKVYRPADAAPEQVDTLYSEVALLKHSVLPGLRQGLRAAMKRWIPAGLRR